MSCSPSKNRRRCLIDDDNKIALGYRPTSEYASVTHISVQASIIIEISAERQKRWPRGNRTPGCFIKHGRH